MKGSVIARRLRNQEQAVRASRIALIGLVFIVGLIEVAAAAEWLDHMPDWLPPAGRIALLAATAAESTWGLIRVSQRERAARDRLEIDKQMVSILVTVAKLTGVDVDVVGCNIWTVYQPRRGEAVLYRAGHRRLSEYPSPIDRTWPKGKGVIGRCWEGGAATFKCWTALRDEHGALEELSVSTWKKLSPAERWGLDRHEFLATLKRYQQILAVPITDDQGQFLGCISLDIPTDRPAKDGNCLGEGPVREVLARAAQSVKHLI